MQPAAVLARRSYAPALAAHVHPYYQVVLPLSGQLVMSEVLVLGVPGEDGQVSVLTPTRPAQLGGLLY